MRRFAITNQKGGSGKTTTAVNLAAALGEKKKRVLVLDLDPQASASAWLGAPDSGVLLEVFTEGRALEGCIRPTEAKNVDLVPSSNLLGKVEPALAGEVGAHAILRSALDALPQDRWDFVLADCPPSLGILSVSALVACSEVLVPVEAHALALGGVAALVDTVDKVRKRMNPGLVLSALVACRVGRNNLSRDVVGQLRSRFGDLVLESVVRENVRLAEAPSYRRPITQYEPASIGAEDYRSVAAELLRRAAGRN